MKTPHIYESDPEVVDIPQPSSPPPRFFKIQQAQTTYEAAPEVSKISTTTTTSTKFIPSTVRNKVNQSQRKEQTDDIDEEEADMAEYASEEEEALSLKRKADQLE